MPPLGMQEGLGKLPPFLPSVSSLLLFNSQLNPYKKVLQRTTVHTTLILLCPLSCYLF